MIPENITVEMVYKMLKGIKKGLRNLGDDVVDRLVEVESAVDEMKAS